MKTSLLIAALAILATGLMADKCTTNIGSAPNCSTFTSEAACVGQSGCHWNKNENACKA